VRPEWELDRDCYPDGDPVAKQDSGLERRGDSDAFLVKLVGDFAVATRDTRRRVRSRWVNLADAAHVLLSRERCGVENAEPRNRIEHVLLGAELKVRICLGDAHMIYLVCVIAKRARKTKRRW
jgi:hypothetical protein